MLLRNYSKMSEKLLNFFLLIESFYKMSVHFGFEFKFESTGEKLFYNLLCGKNCIKNATRI